MRVLGLPLGANDVHALSPSVDRTVDEPFRGVSSGVVVLPHCAAGALAPVMPQAPASEACSWLVRLAFGFLLGLVALVPRSLPWLGCLLASWAGRCCCPLGLGLAP